LGIVRVFLIFILLQFAYAAKNNNIITVVTTDNWEPFNMIYGGRLQGIGIDFWKLVAKKAGIKYKFKVVKKWSDVLENIKNNKAALTVSTGITDDRKTYAVFSKPYVTYPLVIATKNNIGFIFEINFLKNKKIALGDNFTAAKLMMKNYPYLNYIFVKSTDKALEMVNNSEVFGAVDILPVVAYKINKYEYNNLKVAGEIPIKFKVRFMLSKKYAYLLPKINKAIDEITYNEKEAIYERYITPVKKYFFTSNEIFLYFLIFTSLMIMVLLWIYSLKNELKFLQKNKLHDLNKDYDKLTGTLNKEKLKEVIEEKLKNNKAFSLIMFDIRGFKNINKFYGHHFGDITLLELVSLIKSVLKKEELFARYKGGSFVIVSNDIEVKACERAREIYDTVKSFEFSIVQNLESTFVVKTVYSRENADDVLESLEKELIKIKKINIFFKC